MRYWIEVCAVLIVLSGAVGYLCNSERWYFALAFSLLGGACLFALFDGAKGETVGLLLAFLGGATAVCYAPLSLALFLRRAGKRKREERVQAKRRLQFTLPDKDNTFLRDRLRTSLREETSTEEEGLRARLGYAKGMLIRLKEKNLSPMERLDLEETATLLSLLSKKGKWTAEEQKGINETLARLLKLAAKYEIAV